MFFNTPMIHNFDFPLDQITLFPTSFYKSKTYL